MLGGNVAQGREVRHCQILHRQVLRVFEHQIDEYALDRREQHVAAMGKTIANQLLCALIAGEGPRGVAVDHAWQLVEQQYQGQPALGQFGPVLQLSVQRLFDQCTEAFARLGILL